MKTLVHLFPRLLNLYGDYANVPALSRLLTDSGVENEIIFADGPADVPWDTADFLFLGSGTERSLVRAAAELAPYKPQLEALTARGGLVLATGDAGALLLERLTLADGTAAAGLGLVSGAAVFGKRWYGDVIGRSPALAEELVGSYNTGAALTTDAPPLCEIEFDSAGKFPGAAGFVRDGVFAAPFLGPFLQRNPAFAVLLAQRLCGEGFTPDLSRFRWALEGRAGMLAVLRRAGK